MAQLQQVGERYGAMMYLIGGAARAGKTLLAQRLLKEHTIPCFCVDYFVSALDQGAPELGSEAESPNKTRAPKLWPSIAPMLRNIVEVETRYTVEGDALWSRGAASLIQAYPGQVTACFLGYFDTTPERKLGEIRAFSGGVNDWIQHHPDDYVLDLVREMIEYSRFVKDECATLGMPHFDVSDDFQSALDKAYRALI